MPVYQYWLDILIIFTATLRKINILFLLNLSLYFRKNTSVYLEGSSVSLLIQEQIFIEIRIHSIYILILHFVKINYINVSYPISFFFTKSILMMGSRL